MLSVPLLDQVYRLPPLPPSSKTRWLDDSMVGLVLFLMSCIWFSKIFWGFPMDLHRLLMIPVDFQWFWSLFIVLVFIDFHWWLSIFIDITGFRWLFRCKQLKLHSHRDRGSGVLWRPVARESWPLLEDCIIEAWSPGGLELGDLEARMMRLRMRMLMSNEKDED